MSKVDFELKRGTSEPLLFRPVDASGNLLKLSAVEWAVLNIRPMYGLPLKFDLTVTDDGLAINLQPSNTKHLEWTAADYEVKVSVRGIVKVIFEGRLKLSADLGV